MSLINDALRKASQSQRGKTGGMAPGKPLKPTDTGQASPSVSALIPILIILVLLAVGGWYGYKYWRGGRPLTANAPIQPASVPPTKALAPPSNVPGTKSVAPPLTKTNPAAVTNPPAQIPAATSSISKPNPASTNVAEIAEVLPPPQFPPLKLQAIYFRASRPAAMINGQLCYRGDMLNGGVKLVEITRQSITLEMSGIKTNLYLR